MSTQSLLASQFPRFRNLLLHNLNGSVLGGARFFGGYTLAMAGLPITESAASARALLAASPPPATEATATGELVTEWLKITLVPLLVFLLGACLWGCIKKCPAWRMLTNGGGSARNGDRVGSSRIIDSNRISGSEGEEHAVPSGAASVDVESGAAASSVDSTLATAVV